MSSGTGCERERAIGHAETVDEQNTLSDFVLTVQPSTIVPGPCVHYTVHSRNMIYSTALYIPRERPPLRKARPSRDTTHTLCRRASFVPFSVHGSAANSTDWLIRFTQLRPGRRLAGLIEDAGRTELADGTNGREALLAKWPAVWTHKSQSFVANVQQSDRVSALTRQP